MVTAEDTMASGDGGHTVVTVEGMCLPMMMASNGD